MVTNESDNRYSYFITTSYINGTEEVIINPANIMYGSITYNYDTSNTPIFILKLNLQSDLYNKMQDNRNTGKIVMTISKRYGESGTPIRYIRKQFSYHFPTMKFSNIKKDLDGSSTASDNDKEAYIPVLIGLVDDSMMNANKMIINNIFKNSNNISIIHYYTSSMRMIIEPFDYMDSMDLCIVPPMEGITRLLEYMNNISSFYTTGYKFFMDYNYTYLLSNKGNSIDVRDGTFTTIKIVIDKEEDIKGMKSDYEQKIYTVQIKEDMTSYNKDGLVEKKFNKIYGVLNDGEIKVLDLDIDKGYDSKDRYLMIRVPNDNIGYLENIKNSIEIGADTIDITIGDVDNSLFVPYKQFVIEFFRERRDLNGVYVLSQKQEIYQSQGEGNFNSVLMLKFRKKH